MRLTEADFRDRSRVVRDGMFAPHVASPAPVAPAGCGERCETTPRQLGDGSGSPERRLDGVVAASYGVFTRWRCWSSTQGCLTKASSVSPAAVITEPFSCRPFERMYTPSSSRSSATTV